ncbi:MAG: tol-pal system protein YbgF [Pseudomonadota bacterium]
MFFKKNILLVLFITASPLIWASDKNLSLRMDRLERMMQNNSPVKIFSKIKTLQKENQQLRSQLEELNFQHDKLKNRLHALNEDMDRRVLLLETQTRVDDTPDSINNSAEEVDKQLEGTEDLDNQDIEQQMLEQNAYQSAFDQLKAQRYGKAENSFKAFIQSYPESSYAHLAQYWLAESSYAQRNFKQSINNYSGLLKNYPNSPKRIESHLKIAFCYYELGDIKNAKAKLKNLIKNYPNSTEAGQAKRLLKKLK